MKHATIATLLFITLATAAMAQSTARFELELDPLAYALGGASGHAALSLEKDRLQLGYGALEVPESFRSNPDVVEEFQAISLKWDHFFTGEGSTHGFFAGPTFDYLFLSYTDEAGEKSELSRPGVGLRTGYRFDLFSESETFGGLYVTPWVSASYIFDHEEVTIAGENYEVGSVKVFPTLHVGWRF